MAAGFNRRAVEYAAARLALATLEQSPRPFAEVLAAGWARLIDLTIPRLRRTAERNLKLAGMEPELADEVFCSIARVLVSVARFPRINKQNVHQWIRYEGFEHFEAARNRGKGVLFATAHLGNWELSAFAHALMSAPMHIVVRPLDNPWIDRLLSERRRLSGNRVIEKKDFARAILRALAQNEAVGVLIDQNVAPEEGVFVPFFGIPACAGTGFARIAARSGATVIPGFALWNEAERRYVLRFYPPVEITGDAAEDTRRLQARIEAVIRQYPDQWLWVHRRWKTRPPGEPPLY